MGLLDNQTQGQYYEATSGQGDYQFTSLDDIINGFMIIYVGEGKIITKVNRILQLSGMIIEKPNVIEVAMTDSARIKQEQND